MNKVEMDELMEYNLEYMEARNSEDIFGGDYTSAVDLKYANKKIDKLQRENKLLKEQFDMIYKGKKLKLLSIEKCKNKYCFNYELERGDGNE